MIKILVTGSHGQLGSELQKIGKGDSNIHAIFTDVDELDITNEEQVIAFFREHNFDYCINCAAYTAVDKAETEKEICDKINVTGPQNLALGCKEVGAVLIHISTDFVFDGKASSPINENQATAPVNYYGLSKLKGEEAITTTINQYFIFRTSWLYAATGSNFIKTMLRLAESHQELSIICDQVGTPTYALDLAQLIIDVIKGGHASYGIYHFSNEGVSSWYDFTKAIFEYKEISIPVNPIPTEKYPTPASRPHYSVLDKTKVRETFGVKIPHWRESLKRCLKEL